MNTMIDSVLGNAIVIANLQELQQQIKNNK